MVLSNDGKNRIRDLIILDLDSGEHGTVGTSPTVTDTDLGAGVTATNAVLSTTTGNKLINNSHILLSTIGNGTTYKEYGIFMNGGAVMLDHLVYPDFAKTSSIELHTIITMRIE